MKRLFILLAVFALCSCQSVPPVFVTAATDAAITSTSTDIDAISGAATTLQADIETIKPGDVLTVEKIEKIKQGAASLVSVAKKAKVDIKKVEENHKQDNKAASEISVSLVKETAKNNSLLKWIFILGGIVALGIAAAVLKLLGKF